MLEHRIRVLSEALARAIDRRLFLRRAGSSIAAGAAALVIGPALTGNRAEAAPKPLSSPNITCSPPGPYCNTGGGNLSGCNGAHCYQHLYNGTVYSCQVYYQYYQVGCWTTASSGGYWTCCDCACGTPRVATCGCAQFNAPGSPPPSQPE